MDRNMNTVATDFLLDKVRIFLLTVLFGLFRCFEKFSKVFAIPKIFSQLDFEKVYYFFTSTKDGADIFIVGSYILTGMFILLLFKAINDADFDEKRRQSYSKTAYFCNFMFVLQLILLVLHSYILLFNDPEENIIELKIKNEKYHYDNDLSFGNYICCVENTILSALLIAGVVLYNLTVTFCEPVEDMKKHCLLLALILYFFNILSGSIGISNNFEYIHSFAPLFRTLQFLCFYHLKRLFDNFETTIFESLIIFISDRLNSFKKKRQLLANSVKEYTFPYFKSYGKRRGSTKINIY